jgi:hypothetical protein
MKLEVYEILHQFNDGMEKAISQLESLGTIEGFSGQSVTVFVQDAERVRAGVNRWIAEEIHKDADQAAARIDKERAAQEQSTKTED